MKKVKEGFSLVELMIALAMTAIVMLIVIGLIGFGVRNMTVTRAEVSLQQDVEDAVRHVTCYAMEASKVDAVTLPDRLMLINDHGTSSASDDERWVYWMADSCIYFAKEGTDAGEVAAVDGILPTAPDELENYLLAENVAVFTFEEVKDPDSSKNALKITLEMKNSESAFSSSKMVYLRNQED